jgi:hypothetical protein
LCPEEQTIVKLFLRDKHSSFDSLSIKHCPQKVLWQWSLQRYLGRCHNTQHNDTQHNDIQQKDTQYNDTQHNDTQHNDTQHNESQNKTFSIKDLFATLSIATVCHYADCLFRNIYCCAGCRYADSRGAISAYLFFKFPVELSWKHLEVFQYQISD